MKIKSIELENFRNYSSLSLEFDEGINIFYGDNAQGKTNLLEAVYMACTSKSQKSARDREMISFDSKEAHIKLNLVKAEMSYRIDMHLKKNNAKGIAVNGVPIKRASELFGIANVVIFSPEDLNLIKNGPAERRRFMDMELCQLNRMYVHELISYNRVINQKNKLLKSAFAGNDIEAFIDVYNEQIIKYGSEVIRLRQKFTDRLNGIIKEIHKSMTGNAEELELRYEPNVRPEEFEEALLRHRTQELKNAVSLIGPHKDDLSFILNGVDLKHFGSQGQQRTAVLSLKLSELKLAEDINGDRPVLLLDDVLSELDRNRQNMLLSSINDIQTLITCTGLDDFIDNRFHIDSVYRVSKGHITGDN